jgi:hypothetical protein
MSDTPNDRGGGETAPRELARVTLPQLYTVPPNTRAKNCDCRRRIWMLDVDGKVLPITCTETFIDTKQFGRVMVPGVKPPTATDAGLGFNHFIDCPNRRAHRKRDDTAHERADVAKAIALAEQWSHAHGLRCTGAPNLRETCGGFAVVVFLLDKRLFATPCSAHADAVLAALRFAGRMRDVKFFPVQAYLEDAEPERAAKFVERAKAVADRNVRDGFSVPRAGPLL